MVDMHRVQSLAEHLLAVDTTSGRSLEAVHALIESHLAHRPDIVVERLPGSADGRPSLLCSIGGDGPAGLLLCGHLDTVPAGDGWTCDPHALTAVGDRWIGRGACDMTVFCALAVELLASTSSPGPLHVLLLPDEELGSLGAAALVEHWPEGRRLPEACVIGEPTSLQVIGAHTGHLKATIIVRGAMGHSGTPGSGHNAIAALGKAQRALEDVRIRWEAVRTATSDLLPVPHPVLAQVGIEGGVAWNVIPDEARLRIGIRALPGQPPEALLGEVVEALTVALDGEDWTLDVFNSNPPLHTSPDACAHAWLCDRIGQAQPQGAAFCSDGGHLASLGVMPVLFGPGSIDHAHKPDEFVPVAEVEAAAVHLEAMIESLCGGAA